LLLLILFLFLVVLLLSKDVVRDLGDKETEDFISFRARCNDDDEPDPLALLLMVIMVVLDVACDADSKLDVIGFGVGDGGVRDLERAAPAAEAGSKLLEECGKTRLATGENMSITSTHKEISYRGPINA
jgi:hypothetical protein